MDTFERDGETYRLLGADERVQKGDLYASGEDSFKNPYTVIVLNDTHEHMYGKTFEEIYKMQMWRKPPSHYKFARKVENYLEQYEEELQYEF